jgi:phosphate transport system substrate-binding protein
MAASSRPLNTRETEEGIIGVPIARDALAVTVGVNNPYKGGLTIDQLREIFQGQITNWSQVGGPNLPIKVINRSLDSGTHSFFREAVLSGKPFAPESSNFTTVERDETTPILRALGNDGISYSTVTQIENQKSVRIVPINGISPADRALVKNGTYPISRVVYLAVPRTTSPAVKEFIDIALSPAGQQAVQRAGFVPLQ